MTDLQIVYEIKNKDIKTYEYIIEKYSKQVFYLVYSILHISCTKEDMEECVSDVFFEAWTNVENFNPNKGSFKTWLFILAKYKALGYKRRLSKQKVVNIDDLIIEDSIDTERQIVSRENQERVIEIINGFNKTDRELFIRRYFYNEKINELIRDMNLTRSAIDNRLLRARKMIKEVLSYE